MRRTEIDEQRDEERANSIKEKPDVRFKTESAGSYAKQRGGQVTDVGDGLFYKMQLVNHCGFSRNDGCWERI